MMQEKPTMLIYDTHRHCLVSEAGIPLRDAFPRLFYGVSHTMEILLGGAAPAASWSAAVDDDLVASSTPMCRTVSGIEAEETPDGVRLSIPLDTLTQTFKAKTEGRKEGTLALLGIYGYGSGGAPTLYAQIPVLCLFTVDAEASGTVEPVSVTYLTQAQVQALSAGEVASRFSGMTFTAHDAESASADYDAETNTVDFGLVRGRDGGLQVTGTPAAGQVPTYQVDGTTAWATPSSGGGGKWGSRRRRTTRSPRTTRYS